MVLTKKDFQELSANEMQTVNGGAGPVVWLVAGMIVGYIVDGLVINTTGKSVGEWVSTGINWTKSWF